MPPERYDIFREFPQKGPIWVEAVENLDQAKKRLIKLNSATPGDYFVYDSATQAVVERLKKSA